MTDAVLTGLQVEVLSPQTLTADLTGLQVEVLTPTLTYAQVFGLQVEALVENPVVTATAEWDTTPSAISVPAEYPGPNTDGSDLNPVAPGEKTLRSKSYTYPVPTIVNGKVVGGWRPE